MLPKQTITTAQATVTEQLRQAIATGTLPGGHRLVLRDLAAQLGVSVTPVREALRELTAEGLVDFDAYRSTVVHMPTAEELVEVYEMRTALTPLAVVRGVTRITKEQITEAYRLCAAMRTVNKHAEWLSLNRRFHQLLDGACQSPQLTLTLSRLAALNSIYVNMGLPKRPGQRPAANHEHHDLVDAYAANDPDMAIRLALIHLRKGMEAAVAVMETPIELPPPDPRMAGVEVAEKRRSPRRNTHSTA